jgi:hypothetical protein
MGVHGAVASPLFQRVIVLNPAADMREDRILLILLIMLIKICCDKHDFYLQRSLRGPNLWLTDFGAHTIRGS